MAKAPRRPPPKSSPKRPRPKNPKAAEKQRRYRARVRAEEQVLPITIGPQVIDALLCSGLPEPDSRSRRKLAEAITHTVREWAMRALKKNRYW